jgi:hypothetical protein
MRRDLDKVIIESPRRGSRNRSAKTGARVLHQPDSEHEDHPKRISSSRYRQYKDFRTFNDKLGPLRRFLRSNLGRPWNKVYSEVSAAIDRRSISGNHLHEHVRDAVELNCFIGEGRKIYAPPHWFGAPHEVEGFYVHPRTGLLCWKPYRRGRYVPPEPLPIIAVGEIEALFKLNGIWYHGRFKEGTPPERALLAQYRRTPMLIPKLWPAHFRDKRWMVLVQQRQLNRAEMRRWELQNDPAEDGLASVS